MSMLNISGFTEKSPTVLLGLSYQLRISDVMNKNLKVATPADKMSEMKSLMKSFRISGIPIVDGKQLKGIISIEDVFRAVDEDSLSKSVENYMTRSLVVLEDDMPLSIAISYFDKYHFGRFPVVNKQRELVGIVTSRDILTRLLVEMNREMIKLEEKLDHSEGNKEVKNGEFCRRYPIIRFDFQNAGTASSEIKKILTDNNFNRKDVRRACVALYELEINICVHSLGGHVQITVLGDQIEIIASDKGPGIPDIDLALTEGYSTANEWIKSYGFGAGLGLPNIRRVSDDFSIQSKVGVGTTVKSVINASKQEIVK